MMFWPGLRRRLQSYSDASLLFCLNFPLSVQAVGQPGRALLRRILSKNILPVIIRHQLFIDTEPGETSVGFPRRSK